MLFAQELWEFVFDTFINFKPGVFELFADNLRKKPVLFCYVRMNKRNANSRPT